MIVDLLVALLHDDERFPVRGVHDTNKALMLAAVDAPVAASATASNTGATALTTVVAALTTVLAALVTVLATVVATELTAEVTAATMLQANQQCPLGSVFVSGLSAT